MRLLTSLTAAFETGGRPPAGERFLCRLPDSFNGCPSEVAIRASRSASPLPLPRCHDWVPGRGCETSHSITLRQGTGRTHRPASRHSRGGTRRGGHSCRRTFPFRGREEAASLTGDPADFMGYFGGFAPRAVGICETYEPEHRAERPQRPQRREIPRKSRPRTGFLPPRLPPTIYA